MANTKISQLTANTNPSGSEELVYALNNTNGKMTLNTMKTFVQPDLSNYQEKLVSGTNIKTINGNNILGSGNIVISGGGGGTGGSISLNAIEDITAGTIVSLTSAGVKKLRRGFYGTANTGISLTVNSQQYSRIDSVAVNSDTTVVAYMDSSNVYVVAIKWDGETRTVGTPVKVNSSTAGRVHICSPYTGEFIVSYNISTGGMAVAGSVSGTTISVGTEVNIPGEKIDGICITRRMDTDDRSFVMFYSKNSDKKIYSNICTYNSSLAITAGTEDLYRGDLTTSNYMSVSYLGGGMTLLVYEFEASSTYYTEVVYSDVSGATITGYNYLTIYSGTSRQLGRDPKIIGVSDRLVLIDICAGNVTYLLGIIGSSSDPNLILTSYTSNSPTTGRSYCCEDKLKGIIGKFYVQSDYTGTKQIYYSRYKCTDVGIEQISTINYGATNNNTTPTVTRIGNTSICSYIDGVNAVLGNLIYQDESDSYIGVISSAATTGSPVDVTYSGVATTAGLTAGLPLYIGIDGAFSQTGEDGGKQIGIATGSTDALLM